MDNLIDIFSENYGLEWKSASDLIKRMGKVSFRKSEIVVNSGALDDPLYILESGIWSGAKSASFGDSVVWFAFGGEAVVDIICYNAQCPSKKESASKRYRALSCDHSELILNLPLKKIASYLWMTPQSLSRIRAAMNKGE